MTYVRQLLQGKPAEVWHVGPRDMAYKALELMAEKNIGALPVVDAENGGKLLGMFSERDYARKVILKDVSCPATALSPGSWASSATGAATRAPTWRGRRGCSTPRI